jgi:hypothetical protein
MYRIQLYPTDRTIPPSLTRPQVIETLRNIKGLGVLPLETYQDDRLLHYYVWNNTNNTRDDLCSLIEQELTRTGKMFTGKNVPITRGTVGPGGTPSGLLQVEINDEEEYDEDEGGPA